MKTTIKNQIHAHAPTYYNLNIIKSISINLTNSTHIEVIHGSEKN